MDPAAAAAIGVYMSYCFKCGTRLIEKECVNYGISDGMIPFCPKCGEFLFPKFSVAVSMAVFSPDFGRVLLIKQYGRDRNILVSGYVMKTESLETTLERELMEEVGLKASSYRFNASEYFEKSQTLMCNFIVRAGSENFVLSEEVDHAEWYDLNSAGQAVAEGSLAEKFLLLAIGKISSPAPEPSPFHFSRQT